MFRIHSLNKIYHSKQGDVHALKDVSLDIPNRGFVLLTGKSGSGKSTLLNLLGCLDRPTSGTIECNGLALEKLSERERNDFRAKHIGFCYQTGNLIPYLSVRDNILLGSLKENEKELDAILSAIGLVELKNRHCDEISGGQAQRVAIARAAYRGASILLCDEPTSSLDQDSASAVLELLKEESKKRLVIVSSHDSNVLPYANQIFHVSEGVIRETKTTQAKDTDPIIEDTDLLKGRTSWKRRASLCFHPLKKTPVRATFGFLLFALSLGASFPLIGSFFQSKENMLFKPIIQSDSFASLTLNHNGEKIRFAPNQADSFLLQGTEPLLKVYSTGTAHSPYASGPKLTSHGEIQPGQIKRDFVISSQFRGGYLAWDESAKSNDISILAGRAPLSANECAIPAFLYDYYSAYGFQEAGGVIYHPGTWTSQDSFLSFHPAIYAPTYAGGQPLEIVGFVDTKFDLDDYPEDLELPAKRVSALTQEMISDLNDGISSLTFVHPSFIEEHFQKTEDISIVDPIAQSLSYHEDSYQIQFSKLRCYREAVFPFLSSLPEANDASDGIYLPKQVFGRLLRNETFPIPDSAQYDYAKCTVLGTPFSSLPKDSRVSNIEYLLSNTTSVYTNPLRLAAIGDYVRNNGLPSEEEEYERLLSLAQASYQRAFDQGTIDHLPDLSDSTAESQDLLLSYYVYAIVNGLMTPDSLNGESLESRFLNRLLNSVSFPLPTISLEARSFGFGAQEIHTNVLGIYFDDKVIAGDTICLKGEPFEIASSIFDGKDAVDRLCFLPERHQDLVRNTLRGLTFEGRDVKLLHPLVVSYDYAERYILPIFRTWVSILAVILGAVSTAAILLNAMTWARERTAEFTLRRSLGMKKVTAYLEMFGSVGILTLAVFLLSIPLGYLAGGILQQQVIASNDLQLAFFVPGALSYLILFAAVFLLTAFALLPSVLMLSKKNLLRPFD
ncbi:MAG: ATP-binding cassette domain-containing protein [Candidatus Enteromonas sp.]